MNRNISKYALSTLAVFVFVLANVVAAHAGPIVTREKIVAIDGSGDYTRINDAISDITDAGPDKPYRITVKPGVYNETLIDVKPYISLIGSGQENTRINGTTACGAHTLQMEDHTALKDITVTNGYPTVDIAAYAKAVVVENVTAVTSTGEGCFAFGIITRWMSEATIHNVTVVSNILSPYGQGVGMEIDGANALISGCNIKVNSPQSGYGIISNGSEGVTVVNSKIESVGGPLTYGLWAAAGTATVLNSVVSGASLAVFKNTGVFKIGSSQIIGGHNGLSGTDKIVNSYDENFNPLPNF